VTPADLRTARKALGLTQSGLAAALRLSPKNGDRSIRIWEQEGNTVPGPVQVAVGFMLEQMGQGKTASKTPAETRRKARVAD
jgi:hypothetical protein